MRPVGAALVALVRLLVGAHPRWVGTPPTSAQCIFFANHTSHIDTLAIWAALSAPLRARSRPVAARDYWDRDPVRRYLAVQVLHALLIERHRDARQSDPLLVMSEALEHGQSLILFPEGTRGAGPLPAAFRGGLYHLAMRFPEVLLVPVYLENLHRALPKGTWIPIPLICTVRFGMPLERLPEEQKESFLERARAAVVALA